MSAANPVKDLGYLPTTPKPDGFDLLPLVFVPRGFKALVFVRTSDGLRALSLEEAERQNCISVRRYPDAIFGVVSDITIGLKSSKVRITVVPIT